MTMAEHTLTLTTKQANKLYALTGRVGHKDEDMRDVRAALGNALGGSYAHYVATVKVGGKERTDIHLSLTKGE
jgi:hypothetical protein